MKICFGVLFILIFYFSAKADDSIPANLRSYVLRQNLTIEKEEDSKTFSLNKFCDYNLTSSYVVDSLSSASFCLVDSMATYLSCDARYYIIFNHTNRSKNILSSVSTLFEIKNKKVQFLNIMDHGEEGAGRNLNLLPNQFIDIRDSSKFDIYKRDIILYNIVEDSSQVALSSINRNSKKLLLCFLENIKKIDYDYVHIAYITRYGMHVIKDFCFSTYGLLKTFDNYHRLIKEIKPSPYYE